MTAEAPYPGLHPFDRGEADVFFGREKQTDQLLDKLGQHRFLAVVGQSGCGKSSLVRAGLIANLSAGFMVSAGARWRIAVMRPGRHPMARLSKALLDESVLGRECGVDVDAQGLLGATLRRGPLGLVEALRDTPLPPETNLLLVVDQFEEIFRFSSEKERNEADAFVALMLESAEQQEFPIYVVMTMRSDYIGDCGLFTGLPEHVSESQFLTPRLLRTERAAAIAGPARVFGGDVEPALVNHLLNETGRDPDRLPVLQHLLMRMWDRACEEQEREGRADDDDSDDGPTLTFEHCKAVGGLTDALSNHANEAYDRLNADQKVLAEIMFRRLCELGWDHKDTRRPTPVQEIAEVAGVAPDRVIEVADVFRDPDTNFIVPGKSEPLFPRTDLDISHESLIRQWDKLRDWARREAESARTYQHLAFQAEQWNQGKAALWVTPNLENAQKWQKDENPNGAWATRYGGNFELAIRFLSASKEEQQKEKDRKKREQKEKLKTACRLAEVEKQRADTERQRAEDREAAATNYRRVAVAAGLLFAIAAGTSIWGWVSAEQAEKAKTQALKGEATALGEEAKLVAILSELALGKGDNREAVRIPLRMFVKNADRIDKINSIPSLPTLPKLASALNTSENALFMGLYRPSGVTLEHPSRLYAANFSEDGRFVVTAADSGVVRVWDLTKDKPISETLRQRSRAQARWASFDPDGNRVVVAYFDASSPDGATAKIWDWREKAIIMELVGHSAPVNVAVFSRDGTEIVTGSFDKTARLWRAADGKFLQEFKGHEQGLISADFNPDGDRVVTAAFDRTARIWDTESGIQVASLVHPSPVISAHFDEDGKYVVTGSMDSVARVWDPVTCEVEGQACEPLRTLQGHHKPVTSVMFNRDGTRVLTASRDKTVRIWDWNNEATLAVLQGPSGSFGWIARVVFGPKEDQLLAMFGGTSAQVWDLAKNNPIAPVVLEGHGDEVRYADFDRNGDLLVTASGDTTARVWNLTTNEQVHELEHDDPVYSAAFDPSGRWIVTAAGKAAHIWDRQTGKRVGLLKGHENRLTHARFASAGGRVVTSSIDGTARLWDSRTRKELISVSHDRSSVKHVDISPDATRMVTASSDGTARIWDAATGNEVRVLGGHSGAVNSAVFDAEGGKIVTASEDGKLRVWDAKSGASIDPFPIEPSSVPASAVFSPDGRYIVAAVDDGSARIMDAKTGATLATLHRHGKAVNWAAFDADGRRIVTASADGTARVWNVPTDRASKIELACGLLAPLTDEEQELLGPACSDVQVSAR